MLKIKLWQCVNRTCGNTAPKGKDLGQEVVCIVAYCTQPVKQEIKIWVTAAIIYIYIYKKITLQLFHFLRLITTILPTCLTALSWLVLLTLAVKAAILLSLSAYSESWVGKGWATNDSPVGLRAVPLNWLWTSLWCKTAQLHGLHDWQWWNFAASKGCCSHMDPVFFGLKINVWNDPGFTSFLFYTETHIRSHSITNFRWDKVFSAC